MPVFREHRLDARRCVFLYPEMLPAGISRSRKEEGIYEQKQTRCKTGLSCHDDSPGSGHFPHSPVEGMCPMAHFINVTCAVMLGPWYAFVCALAIGIIRMTCMGIPPLALTGAIFGAFLSGMLYRMSRGRLVWAFAGEVIGTGIIGAILSYPVMTFVWGKPALPGSFMCLPSLQARSLEEPLHFCF